MSARDDVYEYSLDNHHSEEEGKLVRKKIYTVTIILSLITALEVAMGMYVKHGETSLWHIVKILFIALTVVKAAYIVMVFMHMKDETHSFRNLILIPYYIFMLDILVLLLNEGFNVGKVLSHWWF